MIIERLIIMKRKGKKTKGNSDFQTKTKKWKKFMTNYGSSIYACSAAYHTIIANRPYMKVVSNI